MIATSIFGGLLIGLAAVCLMLFQGRIAGISSIVYRAIFQLKLESWALTFVIGLVLGPLLVAALNGPSAPVFDLAWWQVGLGGLLVGFGSRLGSGSGPERQRHLVCTQVLQPDRLHLQRRGRDTNCCTGEHRGCR